MDQQTFTHAVNDFVPSYSTEFFSNGWSTNAGSKFEQFCDHFFCDTSGTPQPLTPKQTKTARRVFQRAWSAHKAEIARGKELDGFAIFSIENGILQAMGETEEEAWTELSKAIGAENMAENLDDLEAVRTTRRYRASNPDAESRCRISGGVVDIHE